MLKNITFGQYINSHSVVHRVDARLKIIFTIVYIVMVFTSKNPVALASTLLFSFILFAVAKIPLKMLWRSMKPLLPIVIFTGILNMFFVQGDPLIEFWIISISKQGVIFSAMLAFKILGLIAGSSLLTYTTSPLELTFAIEQLLTPFKWFKLPVHELAMMMTIALRMIPTLIEETDKIMSAQKSRGANLDTGKLMQRIKALVPVLVPLFISSFRRADELALAMETRCYHGGEGRTRLKVMKFGWRDLWATLLFAAVAVFVFTTKMYVPAVI